MAIKDIKKSIPNWTRALTASLTEMNLVEMKTYQLLCDWAEAFEKNGEIAVFLVNPSISLNMKYQVLDGMSRTINEASNQAIVNVVKLLVKRGKLDIVEKILLGAASKILDQMGVKRLKIYSRSTLTNSFKAQLQEEMQAKFGKKIVADYENSDEILAGIRVVEADKILDLTVNDKIKKLFQKIMLETKLI